MKNKVVVILKIVGVLSVVIAGMPALPHTENIWPIRIVGIILGCVAFFAAYDLQQEPGWLLERLKRK